jgi:antibiotic biosynthesis monooxygenase (ABM) superfamily enzyme
MSSDTHVAGTNPPVTFSAVWNTQAGKWRDFEPFLQALMEAASKFPGNPGATVLRPNGNSVLVYQSIIAFDSRTHFEGWDSSAS